MWKYISRIRAIVADIVLLLLLIVPTGYTVADPSYNILTEEEQRIILRKGTERPFSGEFNSFYERGTYLCRQCDQPLFESDAKFDSKTGWPSFDEEIEGSITIERDFSRKEILCSRCGGHLGHLFYGEGFTDKNTRHCVNSLSLSFIPESGGARAYFAGGCFWGVEYYLEKMSGVLDVTSGFMGGTVENPSYDEVIKGRTGHVETVEVHYDPSRVNYESLAKMFFEIHDPTQTDGQGPDKGEQYLSQIFVSTAQERETVDSLIDILERTHYSIATEVRDLVPFYRAEEYHQDYYQKTGGTPYCHSRTVRFE